MTNQRHKHYEAIVAFAEGRDIQYRVQYGGDWVRWTKSHAPDFLPNEEWRVEPEPREPRRWWATLAPKCDRLHDGRLWDTPEGAANDAETVIERIEVVEVIRD